ncbi:kinesin-like protein KIN-14F isoform X1 [Amborella trichopoda]|uniref:kinesin-like protein KIN-14F isoform X1 n=2 Tax=Amborella trichopoda TaxID=13333 RepID=UPI0009C06BBF|nr:kinesin-like protein KIN-14F isoform X1 [Amborella trichopoda]|eukprot:XP_011628316.2 kinesin-like protein KIN-14F isoform X1 [Amborella trichopoda]
MPQESHCDSGVQQPIFTSPCKSFRGLKMLNNNHENSSLPEGGGQNRAIYDGLAMWKAEEAAYRRYQATEWLRQMDHGANETLSNEPSEEEFCLALRNGLILCNVLNKVNPGSVSKVVESPNLTVPLADGAAQSAIQYFENMRNFLVAVKELKLLTFEASDLEKGGSSTKVVDCILCLKGFHEWRQAGCNGIWRFGGITKTPWSIRGLPSSCQGAGNMVEPSENSSLLCEGRLSELLDLSSKIFLEESNTGVYLSSLFDRFGFKLLRTLLLDMKDSEDFTLNGMLLDNVLGKVTKEFNGMLLNRSNQVRLLLKDTLRGDDNYFSKDEFLEAFSRCLDWKPIEALADGLKKCSCGGMRGENQSKDHKGSIHEQQIDRQQKELGEIKFWYNETKEQLLCLQSNWEDELNNLDRHIHGLAAAASSYHKVLEENRQLYNQVMDLKGSIRVYCRVRPFLPGQSDGQSTVDYIGENGNIMIVNPDKSGKDARRMFTFNKVFGTNAMQDQVFADTQPLIRSVLDGYNVCIFAYGQTGSGKTYTMTGPELMDEDTWGVNYRALRDLFQISKDRMDVITYEVSVQMIEIYNEQVRDLLVADGSNRRLEIRNNSQINGCNVPDANLVTVRSTQDVLDLMKMGHRNRAVGATALNERSSRSHSVLTVHVQGTELASGSILRGCLHLVDLAGSERVDKSEAVGERLKEAQHINKSLSALGDVISALAQKSTHIPYRNSKLTQLLQDSLGGHAKTLMFVHINPEPNAYKETISTLKFAERVASVELGAASSNKESGEVKELKQEISNLKLALEKKEAEVEQLQGSKYSRSSSETQRTRIAVSPINLQRQASSASSKPEHNLQTTPVEFGSIEVRSHSSGKQRRPHHQRGYSDKELDLISPLVAPESPYNSRKLRSPSPPIRRSLSADRSALKSRAELETRGDKGINKSMAIPSTCKVSEQRGWAPQDLAKQDSISDMFYQLCRSNNPRKIYPEEEGQEEEQFKVPALSVRHGGVKKPKPEAKAKPKLSRTHGTDTALTQLSSKANTADMALTERASKSKRPPPSGSSKADVAANGEHSELDTEGSRKSDFSEPDMWVEHVLAVSTAHRVPREKKPNRSTMRNLSHVESRVLASMVDPFSSTKHENKPSNDITRHGREGAASIPDLRRSRSSPRGKFTFL